jgi:Outer membrane efflux protein
MLGSPSGRRYLSRRLALGALLFIPGCAALFSGKDPDYDPHMPPPLRTTALPMIGARADAGPSAPPAVRTVGFHESVPGPLPAHVLPAPTATSREVTVSLDSALRMAEAQNAQIALARKRVEEAAAAECNGQGPLARVLHHNACDGEEGGTLGGGHFAAEAKTWQRRVELARTTNETLLDAGNTYYDLLTARRGEVVGRELEKYQESLLRRAEDLAKTDRSAAVLVESLRADIAGRHAVQAKIHQQGDAAAAKLAYLLNLPPESEIVPQDATLVPVDLVDASVPAEALIERAQADGPGIHELSGLLATIEAGINSVHPCLARIPSVARQLQRAQFKLDETHLALEDLRGKLALGVIEARSAIMSGRGQVRDSADNIRHAAETYRLSDLRLRENAPGASNNDVSQSIRGLELAHFTHISAVAAYNKAQLRLLLLLGRWDPQAVCPFIHP